MELASKCHIVTCLRVPLGTDFSKLSESPWLGIESETPIPCFSYLRQTREAKLTMPWVSTDCMPGWECAW